MHFVTFHSHAFCFGNIELNSQLPEMLCSSQVFRHTAGFAKNTFIFITCLDHSSASFKHEVRTFLLAQWIKICQPMKGTWVLNPWSRKMPLVHHNYWSPRALTLKYHTAEARAPSLCSATREATYRTESAHSSGDLSLIPRWGIFPGEGNGNPLQYSCLGNPMDRGAWWATVHGIPKSWTQLRDFHFFTSTKVKYTPTFKDQVEKRECEIFRSWFQCWLPVYGWDALLSLQWTWGQSLIREVPHTMQCGQKKWIYVPV